MARTPSIRAFRLAVVVVAIGTVAGLAILWPGGLDPQVGQSIVADTIPAEVVGVEEFPCPADPSIACSRVKAELSEGPEKGRTTELQLGGTGVDPDVSVGDRVRLVENVRAPGRDALQGQDYSLSDFERRRPMLLLALVFAVLVVLFGRLRGALSLVGLAVSLAVVLLFMVPAILDGESPLAVAIVGSLAVMLATILLAHGTGPKSVAAILGTTVSLGVTAALAVIFVGATHLTGLSSEEAAFLGTTSAGISLDGLLLAGMVVGALGVLDDVTISQASTVLALRAADPAQGVRRLFTRAMDVGRGHVSATVNTLVLAYVGASLPVLLIFSSSSIGLGEAINLELVAKEVVATLVGSIGLIAAVPLTTGLAAWLARGIPADQIDPDEHAGHAH